MKRFREPTLRYVEINGESHILCNNRTYKWNNPKYKYISYIEDDAYECDIINSVLIITDIRYQEEILSQPVQLIN